MSKHSTKHRTVKSTTVVSTHCKRMLVMIKPDAVNAEKIGKIITRIERYGKIIDVKMFTFTRELAAEFYEEHSQKSWFSNLLDFMTSGPSVAIVVEGGTDIIKDIRRLIGNTDSAKAKRNTLRNLYGTPGVPAKNAVHGSDSEEAANREIGVIAKCVQLII